MVSRIASIARRELAGYFYSPIAYVVISAFVLITGIFFMLTVLASGQPASLRPLFEAMVWILIFLAPAISMRLIAEEVRSGTLEPLMTSPVSDTEVIVGKWAGAMGFFAVLLSPTLCFVALLACWSSPDYGPIFTGYLRLMLVGGLYLSIGAFASTLTRNQIIAFLITVFVILGFTVLTYFLTGYLPARSGELLFYLNAHEQYLDFAKGLIDLSHFTYFLGGTVLFLVLAVKTLESRKWR